MFSPCVLPSVVISFHVFTDSFLGFYISGISLYHGQQSKYRFGSVPPTSGPRSPLARLAPPFVPRAALSRQAPRLVAKLTGSLLSFAPPLRSPFRVPPGQKPRRTRKMQKVSLSTQRVWISSYYPTAVQAAASTGNSIL
jgi:hypothetical protein